MKISACCAYFPDSLIAPLVRDLLRWGVDVHLWALSATVPEVLQQTRGTGSIGKFLAMNRLLTYVTDADIVLFMDDDVAITPDFVPRYLAAIGCLGLALAQPAMSLGSYSSHEITQQRPDRWARLTNFVEIGPVFSMTRKMLDLVTPFPESNPMGWGLEAHWATAIRNGGLKMGIVDACPVGHSFRQVTSTYAVGEAIEDMNAYMRESGLSWLPKETHRDFIIVPSTREGYLQACPPPPDEVVQSAQAEPDADLLMLWAIASLVRPRIALDMSESSGASTRVLTRAAEEWAGRVLVAAADGMDDRLWGQDDTGVNLLFIDAGPLADDQGRHRPEGWAAVRLAPGGVAVFRSILDCQTEDWAAESARRWLAEPSDDWRWQTFPGPRGLSLLWMTANDPNFETNLGQPNTHGRLETVPATPQSRNF